jgi:predicted transcriptional regulator/septal ring factor EnvC (AmiA/AmiB activator)
MAKKLSSFKINKILKLISQGNKQVAIAKMMHIDQSTVAKYLDKFKAISEQKGPDIASLMFGVKNQQEELQSIVEEFKTSDLTIADVEIALQLDKNLQQCGIKREDYHDFIQVIKKTKDAGYLNAAAKLSHLENETGQSFQEIVNNAVKTNNQVENAKKELDTLNGAIQKCKGDLAEITEKKKKTSDDLIQHIQKIDLTEDKLKKIEPLTLALNNAGTSDEELSTYIESQKLLDEAGISLSIFTDILGKVKVATKKDDGEKLLALLSEYSGLAGVIEECQKKKQSLTQEVSDLEQKVKTKDKLIGEIKIQTNIKAKLEADIAKLQKDKVELGNVTAQLQTAQSANKNLNEENAKLEKQINEQQATQDSLENEIKTREEKVSDLTKLESQRETLLNNISEMEGRLNKDKKHLQAFEGFLGLMQAQSRKKLKKSIEILPALLEELDEKEYSAELLTDMILKDLAGPNLQVLKCLSCHTLIYVDKPSPSGNYQCPSGDFSHTVIVDKDASAILRKALAAPEIKQVTLITKVIPKPAQQQTPKMKNSE